MRPSIPTKYKLPVMAYAAREVGTAIVAGLLRREHGRIEPVERVSIQPRGSSLSRTLFARGEGSVGEGGVVKASVLLGCRAVGDPAPLFEPQPHAVCKRCVRGLGTGLFL